MLVTTTNYTGCLKNNAINELNKKITLISKKNNRKERSTRLLFLITETIKTFLFFNLKIIICWH